MIFLYILMLFAGLFLFYKLFLQPENNQQPYQPETVEVPPAPDYKKIEQALNAMFSKNSDLIQCLAFIGRADGQLRDTEKEIIAKLCMRLANCKDIPLHLFDNVFSQLKMTPDEFEETVKELSSNKEQMGILITEAHKIIGTQKTVHAGERYCLGILSSYSQKP